MAALHLHIVFPGSSSSPPFPRGPCRLASSRVFFAKGQQSSILPIPFGFSRQRRFAVCTAYNAGKGGVTEYGYDLYELLGLDNSASQNEIRSAYRWLQKRCHPDVVGEAGHDMSILLNEAYALLSDPDQRVVYDDMRRDTAEFHDFTGEPLYSVWAGPVDEQRAVFVDESRCIGCLKCALIAPDTFSIENRYGRARAVKQWGNAETDMKDACRSCPVDCISWVDRGKLPALEYVMSKQPRVSVGIEGHTNGGIRSENVFMAADKFMSRFERHEQQQASAAQETSAQRSARMVAAAGIRARGGRWWHHWIGKKPVAEFFTSNWNAETAHSLKGAIVHLSWPGSGKASFSSSRDFKPESLGALYEAAAQRRRQGGSRQANSENSGMEDEYWIPQQPTGSHSHATALPDVDENTESRDFKWNWNIANSETQESAERGKRETVTWNWLSDLDSEGKVNTLYKTFLSGVPVAVSSVAAVLIGMTSGTHAALSETDIVGPLPPGFATSVAMQMFLAATVWYVIGSGISAGMMYATLLVIRIREKESL